MAEALPVDRYAPGGDIYAQLAAQYGPDAAQRVYSAAQTGDRSRVSEQLAAERGKPGNLDESTWSNFVGQITTDPLAAPLESVNNQLQNALASFWRQPYVVGLVILAAVGAFLYFKKR